MKSRSLARAGRIVRAAALLLTLVVPAAFAVEPPPPPPPPPPPAPTPDSVGAPLLYIRDVIVGRSECATCPPVVCPDKPVLVTVRGQFPSACYTLRSLRVVPTLGTIPLVVADVVADTCTRDCSIMPVGFEASVELPAVSPGSHLLDLKEQVRRCPDTTQVASVLGRLVTYDVLNDCAAPPPPPIPVDSLVRTFVRLAIVPEHPCAGDTVTLQLIKNGCPPCVHLVSFGDTAAGNGRFEGVIDWVPMCMNIACIPETLSASMGRLAAGSFRVNAPMTVHVLGTAIRDSTIAFTLPFEFQVGPTCGGPPPLCVAREMFSTVPPSQCALTLAPRDTGDVPLLYSSDLPMAGAQGVIRVPPPFRLTDLRVAAHLTGVHLSMARQVDGFRWLVFTDPGVMLEPGTQQHLLDATIAADPMAPRGLSEVMTAAITLASDADGNALPFCSRQTLEAITIRLCIAAPESSSCDVNRDGRLDVRDLVRMVGCLRHDVADTTACVDCDSSGVFDIADIFCCARDILRGPGVPPDSVHADAAVSVTFDPIEEMGGGGLLVRARVSGARALNAGLLRLEYPGDRWQASQLVRAMSGTPSADVGWYPILDDLEPGHVYFGALRTGDAGSDELTLELVMTPLPNTPRDPSPTDRIRVVGADLAALDGSVVTPKDGLPSVVLEPGATSGGTSIALSPARPNPFNGTTTFAIRLPASAPVDLAVHDLAGRRIATLAHAVYGAGEHTFSWDGAGARDGLYFVRLTVNGQVLSTRVAMLRDGR